MSRILYRINMMLTISLTVIKYLINSNCRKCPCDYNDNNCSNKFRRACTPRKTRFLCIKLFIDALLT